ncbi:pentapeptide repeat-containing protein [Maricaulis sp.]|uniref:pentapeptide repeat-containing protein n=1 Tax=Maricaulis sp. TaxID=1486257 RepID=UPI001B27BD29|nr:pentapeptide repeat-containing protein [Maricaulis sp.]MBO6797898.1 pentapeptide repeat-containing protein [Maricaulis sp.]
MPATANAPDRQQEIDRICDEHARALSGSGGGFARFDGEDLSRLVLTNRDLQDASFADCDLSGADLSGSDLRGANFSGAKLVGARLIGANLDDTDLRGCDMSEADLSASQCQNADFRELARLPAIGSEGTPTASVQSTKLGNARLGGVNFSHARLAGVEAEGADFSDANLNNSRLLRAKLKNAVMQRAILTATDMSGADLTDADMRGALEKDLKLAQAITSGMLTGELDEEATNGFEPDDDPRPLTSKLRDHEKLCRTQGKDGAPASFKGMDMREVGDLRERELTAMQAHGANFSGMDMRDIALQGAKLVQADLRGCDLRDADLRGADLSGANLSHADLRGARLDSLTLGAGRSLPSNLANADCRYTLWEGAQLNGVAATGACFAYARISDEQATTLAAADLADVIRA